MMRVWIAALALAAALSLIESDVQGATLRLGFTEDTSISRFSELTYQLTVKNLEAVTVDSMAVVEGEGLALDRLRPNPYGNAYGASKAWIRSFTLALAAEERARGVGVFTLNPGLLDTGLTREMTVVIGYDGRARAFDRIARLVAAPPEESARLALWLASAATDGSTGIALRASLVRRLLRGLVREAARAILRQSAPPYVRYQVLSLAEAEAEAEPTPTAAARSPGSGRSAPGR